jgi:hypothetical protein
MKTPPPWLEDLNDCKGELKKDMLIHLYSYGLIISLFSLLEEVYIGN